MLDTQMDSFDFRYEDLHSERDRMEDLEYQTALAPLYSAAGIHNVTMAKG